MTSTILLLHYITNSGWNAKTTLSPRESLSTGSQNIRGGHLTSYWLSRFWRNFQSQMHAIGYSCSAWVNCMFYSYYLSCYPRRCLICKCKQQVQVAEHSNTYSYIFTYLENYDTTWKGFKQSNSILFKKLLFCCSKTRIFRSSITVIILTDHNVL